MTAQPGVGPHEGLIVDVGRRAAALGRVLAVVCAQLATLVVVTPDRVERSLVVVLATLAWSVVAVVMLRRPAGVPFVAADAALMATLCLARGWLDLPALAEQANWIFLASETYVFAAPWLFRTRQAVAASGVVVAAYVAGALFAHRSPLGVLASVAVLAGAALASATAARLLRATARRVDVAAQDEQAAQGQVEVAQARQEAQAEHLAVLHDTAAATLMMVGLGASRGGEAFRRHAARDVEILTRPQGPGPQELGDGLRAAAADSGLSVTVDDAGEPGRLPAPVATAMVAATSEALRNVARHAEVDRARVAVRADEQDVVVEISDDGVGFPAGARPGRGIAHSIAGRMQRHGGTSSVVSTPNGVVVRLQWSGASESSQSFESFESSQSFDSSGSADAPDSAATLLRTLRRAMSLALFFVLAKGLVYLLTQAPAYRQPWLAWVAFGALAVVAALLVRRSAPRASCSWLLCAVVLASSVATTLAVSHEAWLTSAHWSWYHLGWFAVAILLGERFRLVAAAVAVQLVVSLLPVLLVQPLDRAQIARFLLLAGMPTIGQLSFAVGGVLVRRIAESASIIAGRRSAALTARRAAEQIQADRQARHAAVAKTAVPLLRGLASGELSTDDPDVRRRALIEAARMRRLLAEGDRPADPLTHELRACAELAERSGVQVDISYRGEGPQLAVEVRRGLTEPVIAALSSAVDRARITVIRSQDEVVVGAVVRTTAGPVPLEPLEPLDPPDPLEPVVAAASRGDGSAPQEGPAAATDVEVTVLRSDGRLWVTSTWRAA